MLKQFQKQKNPIKLLFCGPAKLYSSSTATTTQASKDEINKSCTKSLKMCGWQIHSYGTLEELQYSNKLRIPQIRCASECLIKVDSTTVNPIDVAMLGGYGANLLNLMRSNPGEIEFPLTLGREFCGTLIQKGMAVNKKLQLGQRVWGVVPVHAAGAHADCVVVPDYCVC